MKKVMTLGACAAFGLFLAPACAADLPLPQAPEATSSPWGGAHVGLSAGGLWQSNAISLRSLPIYALPGAVVGNTATDSTYARTAALVSSGALNSGETAAFIGGGQIGYSWRVLDKFVASLETDFQGVAGAGGGNYPRVAAAAVPTANDNSKAYSVAYGSRSLDYLGTGRLRLGYLVTPTTLVYATGGVAYGVASLSASVFPAVARTPITIPSAPRAQANAGYSSFSGVLAGWAAGGGIEWMFMPGWSVRTEYLRYDLGSAQANAGVSSRVILNPGAQNVVLWTNANRAEAHFSGNVARVGVNYHFSLK
jgi:outer membrane immunogenic protein